MVDTHRVLLVVRVLIKYSILCLKEKSDFTFLALFHYTLPLNMSIISESAGGAWPASVVRWELKYSDQFRYHLEGFPNSGRRTFQI